jgi:hypothetical protein
MPHPDPTIESLKERAWQEVAAINQALVEGRIGELKTRLIAQNTRGIAEYIEGKSGFIKECIAKAILWRNTEPDAASDGDSAPLHSRR